MKNKPITLTVQLDPEKLKSSGQLIADSLREQISAVVIELTAEQITSIVVQDLEAQGPIYRALPLALKRLRRDGLAI
jgi:hypothetical protein